MVTKNQLKKYGSLKEKKYRTQEQLFLIEGIRLCEEAVDSHFNIEILLYNPEQLTSQRAKDLIETAQNKGIPVDSVDTQALKKLSDTQHPQGLIAIIQKQETQINNTLVSEPGLLVAIENISDPGNLGTIQRTAAWFGASGLLLSEGSVDYTNPKAVRASMGAVFYLPVFQPKSFTQQLSDLKKRGYKLFLADTEGDLIYTEVEYPRKTVLILGGETVSISEQTRDLTGSTIRIPLKGRGDSLNVSTAAAILLSEITRRK